MSGPAPGDSNRSSPKARLFVLAAAALFSTGGLAIKLTDWPTLAVAGGRSLVAAAVLLALPEVRRSIRRPSWTLAVSYAATMLLFVAATKSTTAAHAVFLQATAPLYVAVLSIPALRERPRAAEIALLLPMACGLALLLWGSGPPAATAPRPRLGNALGVASGVAWAATIVALRRTSRSGPAGTALGSVAAGNALAGGLGLLLSLPLPPPDLSDAAALLWLGVFQIALAYVFLARAAGRVRAFETSLLLLAEPVLNPIWTFLFLGERLSPLALAGCSLVLGSSLLRALGDRRAIAPRPETSP